MQQVAERNLSQNYICVILMKPIQSKEMYEKLFYCFKSTDCDWSVQRTSDTVALHHITAPLP